MPYELDRRLVIGVASSAMFDLTESDAVYREEGEAAYRDHQERHRDKTLGKGVAFGFIKRLLSLNDLDADPGIARVWGLALGITPQQIPHYLNTLTAVVLLSDTWVTTHTPADGVPDPKQAVLQAGSAVLIDPLGVPRVRCASGAPLAPPDNDTLAHYRLDGEQWPAFSPQTVVAVKYAATDNPGAAAEFTLTDVDTGQQIVQRAGGVIDLGGTSVPLPDPAVMNIPPDRPESRNR
jgi:hypothetical protein